MGSKKYQMRVRKDVTCNHESLSLGISSATEITSYTVSLPSIEEVLEKTKEIESLKGYEIISVVLIDEDNREHLGEDFDWDEVV